MKALRQNIGNELIHLHAAQALMLGVISWISPEHWFTVPYHPCIRYMYLHEWLIAMVNVGKYTMHGSYGGEHRSQFQKACGYSS